MSKMHRSETILHLIHIWSTLSVSHEKEPFVCHQPFFAGPPNGRGNVNGVIKEYKLLSVLLSIESTCIKVQQWSAC